MKIPWPVQALFFLCGVFALVLWMYVGMLYSDRATSMGLVLSESSTIFFGMAAAALPYLGWVLAFFTVAVILLCRYAGKAAVWTSVVCVLVSFMGMALTGFCAAQPLVPCMFVGLSR